MPMNPTRNAMLTAAEKRHADARLAAIQRLAFPDEVVERAGKVLETLLDSPNDKERRLAAERIRDERGLTRVSKPEASGTTVNVTLNTPWRDANSVEQRPAAKRIPRGSVWSNQANTAPTQGLLPATSDKGDSVAMSGIPRHDETKAPPPVPPENGGDNVTS